jgi:hypothetical protein
MIVKVLFHLPLCPTQPIADFLRKKRGDKENGSFNKGAYHADEIEVSRQRPEPQKTYPEDNE